MNNDPIVRFKDLLTQAEQLGIQLHNAAALATAGDDRQPTAPPASGSLHAGRRGDTAGATGQPSDNCKP